MIFSKQFVMSMFAALSLTAFGMTGCDESSNDEEDNKGGTPSTTIPNCNQGKQGFDSNCKCLEDSTDWTKSGKTEIVDYLASICKLGTDYKKPEFLNASVDDQKIGASCFCYGKKCSYSGYERPELQPNNNDAILYGCDGVPENYEGAVRSCFRSTNISTIKPAIFFPFGACALTMSKCTPSDKCNPDFDGPNCTPEEAKKKNEDTICGFATFGDYSKKDTFTSCPDDGVLVDFVMNIAIQNLGSEASLDVRGCIQGCETDADCHGVGVFDPITQEQSKFGCIETDAALEGEFKGKKAKVCFDRRTVVDSQNGIVLVNPGKYEAK